MNPLPHRIVGIIGLLLATGSIAAGTLVLTNGRISPGVVTLLCATVCATTAVVNLNIAAQYALLNRLAKTREERTAKTQAAYAEAARNARKAGDHITMRDVADTTRRWALVYESEKVGGATDELAIATAFATTIAHERKENHR